MLQLFDDKYIRVDVAESRRNDQGGRGGGRGGRGGFDGKFLFHRPFKYYFTNRVVNLWNNVM